jgi:hypothetical protein
VAGLSRNIFPPSVGDTSLRPPTSRRWILWIGAPLMSCSFLAGCGGRQDTGTVDVHKASFGIDDEVRVAGKPAEKPSAPKRP